MQWFGCVVCAVYFGGRLQLSCTHLLKRNDVWMNCTSMLCYSVCVVQDDVLHRFVFFFLRCFKKIYNLFGFGNGWCQPPLSRVEAVPFIYVDRLPLQHFLCVFVWRRFNLCRYYFFWSVCTDKMMLTFWQQLPVPRQNHATVCFCHCPPPFIFTWPLNSQQMYHAITVAFSTCETTRHPPVLHQHIQIPI